MQSVVCYGKGMSDHLSIHSLKFLNAVTRIKKLLTLNDQIPSNIVFTKDCVTLTFIIRDY